MNDTVLERAARDLTVKRLLALGLVAFGGSLVLMWANGIYLLKQSYDKAESAIEALTEDDLPRALRLMGDARSGAEDARRIMDDPILGLVTKTVPLIDHERESLSVAGDAAANITSAAEDFLTSLSDLLAGAGLGEGLYSDRKIQVDLLADMVPLVDTLLDETGESIRILRTTEPSRFSFVDGRIRTSLGDLIEQRRGLGRLRALADAAPELLGGEGPRTYLLALHSPSEARAGGGLIGVDGLLVLDDGAIELGEIDPIRKLLPPLRQPVSAPGWFSALYGPLGATKDPRLSNLSPDFPTTARVLSRIFERRTGTEVDGVIAMDPLVLGNLTRATGPLEAAGWKVKIRPETARELLLEDVYEHFHGREGHQNGYFKNLVNVVMKRISDGSIERFELVEALADSVSQQRLKLYSFDPDTQGSLRKGGLAGAPASHGDDVQMIFNNNFSANKIDYYLKRTVETEVKITATDRAEVETTVILFNDVPDDAAVNVLVKPGLNDELAIGTNQMTLHALVPSSASDPEMLIDGESAPSLFSIDGTHRMIWSEVLLERGETKRVTFRYAFRLAHEMDLTLIPHAAVRPDRFSISVEAAGDLCLVLPSGRRGHRFGDGGFLRTPTLVEVEIEDEAC